MQTGSRQ